MDELPKVVIEIENGIVTKITTNKKQDAIEIYLVNWDHFEHPNDFLGSPVYIESPESNIDKTLEKLREQCIEMTS